MRKMIGFTKTQEQELGKDILEANRLCMSCNSKLLYNPRGLNTNMKTLLLDVFAIDGSDRAKLDPIRSRYLSFNSRMNNTTFNVTSQPRKKGELKFKAYVNPLKPNEINVVDPEYFKGTRKHRSLTLIHENVHLLFPGHQHPGGVPISFGRSRLGIPYEKAVKNAYCYQYFAEWLT